LDIDEDDIMATSTASPAGAYTAPEFPTLPIAAADNQDHLEHAPEGVILADHAPEAVILAEHVVDRTKCIDCKDFYASVCGRCSICARMHAHLDPTRPPVEVGSWSRPPVDDLVKAGRQEERTPTDFDDKMVIVGAAVVGAGIGALAGGMAAVVGAGAVAYAATRPAGDKIGESARSAGRGVLQGVQKAKEVRDQAVHKAKEVGERLNASDTTDNLSTVAEMKKTVAQETKRAVGGMRWASAQAAQSLRHLAEDLRHRNNLSEGGRAAAAHAKDDKLEEREEHV
jgi:uncharacterized membrane protein